MQILYAQSPNTKMVEKIIRHHPRHLFIECYYRLQQHFYKQSLVRFGIPGEGDRGSPFHLEV